MKTSFRLMIVVLLVGCLAGVAHAVNPSGYTSLNSDYGVLPATGRITVLNKSRDGYLPYFRVFIPPGAVLASINLLDWGVQNAVARHEIRPVKNFYDFPDGSMTTVAKSLAQLELQDQITGRAEGRIEVLYDSFSAPLSQERGGWLYVHVGAGAQNDYSNKLYIQVDAATYNAWYLHAGSNPDGSINWDRDIESVTEYLPPSPKPAKPVVDPLSTTWTTGTSHTITATSTKADTIYGTYVRTEGGTEPVLTRFPSPPSLYDIITPPGTSFLSHVLTGTEGQIVKYKFCFIATNTIGSSELSDVYSYTIDLRPTPPGIVTASPATNTIFKTSTANITVTSTNATSIYYTVGTNPADPTITTSAFVSGPTGVVTLTGVSNLSTTFKLKCMGFNANANVTNDNPSPISTFTYVIDLTPPPPPPPGNPPGAASVSPTTGSWTDASLAFALVSAQDATSIIATYTKTIDGSTPSPPPDPTSDNSMLSTSGSTVSFPIPITPSKLTKVVMKFAGLNQYGVGLPSTTCSYTIDLSGQVSTAPGDVTVNPTTGSWTSAGQTVSVSSANASQIEYAYNITTDGTEPAVPSDPSTTTSLGIPFFPSPAGNEIRGIISGASGSFAVPSSAAAITKIKIKFCGKNASGYGANTQPFSYTVDLKSPVQLPGGVVVSPGDTNWVTAPQIISVSSSNAKKISYAYTKTEDGSEPPAPADPSSANPLLIPTSGTITGASGSFTVPSSAGKNTRIKIRFCGNNDSGYGVASPVYSYSINLASSYKYGDTISQLDAMAVPGSNITSIISTTVGGQSILDPNAKFLAVDATHIFSVAELITYYLSVATNDPFIQVVTSMDGVMTISSPNFGSVVYTLIIGSLMTTADSGYLTGTATGNIQICTNNILFTLYPAGADQAAFKKTIENYGWSLSYGADNVVFVNIPDTDLMTFRFLPYAVRSGQANKMATQCLFSVAPNGAVAVTYPDKTVQFLVPYIHNPESFASLLLKEYGLNCYIDSNTGMISVYAQNDVVWKGMPDCMLYDPGQALLNSEVLPMLQYDSNNLVFLTSLGSQFLFESK